MSNVIPLPPRHIVPKTCDDCRHAYAGPRGLFCEYFLELILFEDIAEECSEYDEF